MSHCTKNEQVEQQYKADAIIARVADQVELNVIHQACRDCVFALYKDEDGHPTQVGCGLGKLEKFREKNAAVEAQDPDGGVCFSIVNGRKCLTFRDRNSNWAKLHAPENYAAQVRKELTIRTDAIILVGKDDEEVTQAQIVETLESLKGQALKPTSVHLVNNAGIRMGRLVAMLTEAGEGLNWNVTEVKPLKNGERPNDMACIDEVAPKLMSHFYAIFRPGFKVPLSYFIDIDRAINDQGKKFFLLKPYDKQFNGLAVQIPFHRMYDGNRAGYVEHSEDGMPLDQGGATKTTLLNNIVDKAEFFSKDEDASMIQEVAAVCPIRS